MRVIEVGSETIYSVRDRAVNVAPAPAAPTAAKSPPQPCGRRGAGGAGSGRGLVRTDLNGSDLQMDAWHPLMGTDYPVVLVWSEAVVTPKTPASAILLAAPPDTLTSATNPCHGLPHSGEV
ncbi:hypothetical protein D6T64_02100 [Cryobacterium melibiosiphilum]|uniref:Uncharacterized protein n=1 Tax=Cryobacterium melibiosiphilum TaxID=995039 RepID=A0A3A5MU18_9MICO|nr:hypothetical protein D6T64_02100 [Cryobacterium melibiosiphilum]